MKDKKIMDLCIFCGREPTKICWRKHKECIEEIYLSNIHTNEELEIIESDILKAVKKLKEK